jgi:polysaccharide export outer membrane protein
MTMRHFAFTFTLFLLLLAGGREALCVEQLDYRIGEGDVLKVLVYDNPDLETTTRVGGNGTIQMPLVGELKIEGLTVSQVASKIAAKLSAGFIRNPQVSVFVEEFRSKRAIIMGEVKAPGLYELSGTTSLMELISKAGGMTTEAGNEVTIKRKNPGNPGQDDLITVNLKNLLEKQETSTNVAIRDGDSVFVPRAGVFFVTGQVRRPDAYKLEAGTTVIKAITMAGGFSELASQKRVRLIRRVDDVETVIKKVPMHTLVMPEDVIVVPESFF